jgi:hypothetical protein
MDRIITLLGEQRQERREAMPHPRTDGRLGPTAPRRTAPDAVGDKPLRFQ